MLTLVHFLMTFSFAGIRKASLAALMCTSEKEVFIKKLRKHRRFTQPEPFSFSVQFGTTPPHLSSASHYLNPNYSVLTSLLNTIMCEERSLYLLIWELVCVRAFVSLQQVVLLEAFATSFKRTLNNQHTPEWESHTASIRYSNNHLIIQH